MGRFLGNKRDKRGNKGRGKQESSDNYDNFRQLFSTLKSMETASRTRNALGERMFETTWTTRDNFFKGPGGQLRPAEGRGWDVGGKRKTNRTKGDKDEWEEGGRKDDNSDNLERQF